MGNDLSFWVEKLRVAKHAAAVLEEKHRQQNRQGGQNHQAVQQRHSVVAFQFETVKKTPLMWIS